MTRSSRPSNKNLKYHQVSSSVDRSAGGERDALDPETLRRTVAEAMGTLPKHLDGLRNGLKGAAAALSISLRPPSAGGPAAP